MGSELLCLKGLDLWRMLESFEVRKGFKRWWMEYEEPQDYHGLFLGEDQSWQAAGSGWGRGRVAEIGHDSDLLIRFFSLLAVL